jgi:hypothetical protein
LEKKKITKISLVISHCESGLNWIETYFEGYDINDITIISKCNKEIIGLQNIAALAPTKVIKLPNFGRCDHSYAYYIQEQFKNQKYHSINSDDMIFFMKDNDRFRTTYYNMDELFTQVSEAGFSCVVKPACDCNGKCYAGMLTPLMMHNRTYLFDFSLNNYSRMSRDKNDNFLNDKYPDMKSWIKDMKFLIPNTVTAPVCYSGMFAAKKKQLLNQSEEAWQRMTNSLARADNLIEGHYAERTWASILSDVDYQNSKAVDEALLPEIHSMVMRPTDGNVCGMASMFYVNSTDVKFKY